MTAAEVGAAHSISIQGPTSAVTGTGAMTALYSVTIPAGSFTVGTGIRCVARSRHTTGSASVSMGWKLGSTTYTYPTAYTTGTTGGDASIEIFTFSSLTAETVNIPWAAFGGTTESSVHRTGVERECVGGGDAAVPVQRGEYGQGDGGWVVLRDGAVGEVASG